jgi:CDP-paratose 2-epimerase
MKYLITGGCGFVGSNLAAEVIRRNHELIVFDNLSRFGSDRNLKWLKNRGEFTYYNYNIINYNDVETVIRDHKPDYIFHLAGQVAMTTSLQNPRLDFETNTIGTHNLLEAVRKFSPESIILYSSTNKVYGDLEYLTYDETQTRYVCREFPDGFDESLRLSFKTPYGCSKGAADQFLLDYYQMFGIRTVVFRHSSMYGGNQHATYDQGWVGWFCQKALEIKKGNLKEPFTISGTGKQVRDVLYADDVVNLYFLASENIEKTKGNAFNIGGGIENSLSLLELFTLLEKELEIEMIFTQLTFRKSDQLVFVANYKKLSTLIGWQPNVGPKFGINLLINESAEEN